MRVVLVDSHPIFRVGVSQLLRDIPGCRVVGEAGTASEAFKVVEAVAPDVVLMEVALPDTDGVCATRELCRRAPRTRVLILSASAEINDAFEPSTPAQPDTR